MLRYTKVFLSLLFPLMSACGGGGGGRPSGPSLPPNTFRTIQGSVAYFTTGPDLTNRDANGRLLPVQGFGTPQFPRGAPNLRVDILNANGTFLDFAETDENGEFSKQVDFGAAGVTQVVLRVRAEVLLPFGTTLRVLPNETSPQPWTFETQPMGDPDQENMDVALAVGLGEGAGALHILDVVYEGMLIAKDGIPVTMPDIDFCWEPGNGASSSVAGGTRATVLVAGGVAGDLSSNTDVWDPAVIMRLVGEYLLLFFFNDVAPDDGTADDGPLVPSAAWREGLLDFWSCQGRENRLFWDTEGLGAEGRVVRYFDIESFFDPALGSLGPDDPNVYQDPDNVGISSRFTVAEVLWDLHDEDSSVTTDADGNEFQLRLTLRSLRNAVPGVSYPYLLTLFDNFVELNHLSETAIELLLESPEDQQTPFPGTVDNGALWPPPFRIPNNPNQALAPPFDGTLSGTVDTQNRTPPNTALGEEARRYFFVDLIADADVRLELTTTGDLIVEFCDLNNNVIAGGPAPVAVPDVEPGGYIVRVGPAPGAAPQVAPFDLRLILSSP